jgi:lipoyl-dependent peroxiredoxin
MTVRHAEAVWEGTLRDGNGTMRVGAGGFEGAYSFASRFEEGTGTNPEELIGSALAGCFSMALSGDLGRAGYSAERIETKARVTLERVNDQPTITKIHLETEAQVPDIDEQTFLETADGAKKGCPVSRALRAVEITLDARLV